MEFERCSRWDVTKTIVRVGGARLGRYGTYRSGACSRTIITTAAKACESACESALGYGRHQAPGGGGSGI
jgi:hypothetical protein